MRIIDIIHDDSFRQFMERFDANVNPDPGAATQEKLADSVTHPAIINLAELIARRDPSVDPVQATVVLAVLDIYLQETLPASSDC